MAGILFIISAPSGSGKSTLVKELMREMSDLEFSVSYTTRAPRGSEVDGREYHFITREEFEAMVRNHEFLECAEVFGNYYGTAARVLASAAERGLDLLLDIDVQGAAQVRQGVKDAVSIFVLPPDRHTLEKRLRNRSVSEAQTSGNGRSTSDQVIERRLNEARKEIEKWSNYDYILVNDRLDESVELLKAIVLAERAKRSAGTESEAERKATLLAGQCLRQAQHTGDKLAHILASFVPAVSG